VPLLRPEKWASKDIPSHPCHAVCDPTRSGEAHCGAKGRVRGDAVVSEKHGNFVVNRGKATASDVLGLIEEVEEIVAQKSGIKLEREVKVWRA